jgi:hypothetical protein
MRIEEAITFEGAKFVEEDGKRLVRNVVMLGAHSSHGYEYKQEATAKAVEAGLYEGVRIFINHSLERRDLMHLAGVFRESRHEDGKVKGTAHLLDDEYGLKFWNIAQTMPEAAGCSHVADGKLETINGKRVVTSITKVFSVDLVVQGATTATVFEGDDQDMARVPRPEPKERQFEFIPRCITEVKDGNATLADDEAGAICFMAWQARYEAKDEDGDYLTLPVPRQSKQQNHKGDQHLKTTHHERTAERHSTMGTIREKINQVHATATEASELLTMDSCVEDVVRRAESDRRHADFLERQRTRPTKLQIREASATLTIDRITEQDMRRKSDIDLDKRIKERRQREHPLDYLTKKQAAEISGILTVG